MSSTSFQFLPRHVELVLQNRPNGGGTDRCSPVILKRLLGLVEVAGRMLHEIVVDPKALLSAKLARAVVVLGPANRAIGLVLSDPSGNALASFAEYLADEREGKVQKEVSIECVVDCVRVGVARNGGLDVVDHGGYE